LTEKESPLFSALSASSLRTLRKKLLTAEVAENSAESAENDRWSHIFARRSAVAAARIRPQKRKSALDFSVQDASAALPQNCQTTKWIVKLHHFWCKRHFGNPDGEGLTKVMSNPRRLTVSAR